MGHGCKYLKNNVTIFKDKSVKEQHPVLLSHITLCSLLLQLKSSEPYFMALLTAEFCAYAHDSPLTCKRRISALAW